MLEKLREYLAGLPIFADEVEREFNSMEMSFTNPEELRNARDAAIISVGKYLKTEAQPYKIIYFQNYIVPCVTCDEKLTGAYVELNNPVNGKGMYLNHLMWHCFTEHGALTVEEPCIDMSNNLSGTRTLNMNLQSVLKLLEGAGIPQDVVSEVNTYFAAKAAL